MRLIRRGDGFAIERGEADDVEPNSEISSSRRVLADRMADILSEYMPREIAQDVANNAAGGVSDETTPMQAVMGTIEVRLKHPGSTRAGPFPRLTERQIKFIRDAVHQDLDIETAGQEIADWWREHDGVTPNKSGAAMDTHFGKDIDPDRVGDGGEHLDRAMDRYQTFHDKRPLRTVKLKHDLPSQVVCVGQVISTMYRTDKWHEDGDDEDYKHVHDPDDGRAAKEYQFGKGVFVYEPAREAGKSTVSGKRVAVGKSEPLPVKKTKALTLLGYCLGFFVQRFDDEEIYEVNPRDCYLFCSPTGDMLAVYSPTKGFLAIMAGGKLNVIKDGIVG